MVVIFSMRYSGRVKRGVWLVLVFLWVWFLDLVTFSCFWLFFVVGGCCGEFCG